MTDVGDVPEQAERVSRTRMSGKDARFVWERTLRSDSTMPRHLKGFLLLVGTYMSNNGRDAMPSVARLAEQFRLLPSRVFELLAEAERLGWIETQKRPGKPSERLPAIPTPAAGSGGVPLRPDPEGPDPTPPAGSDPTPPAGVGDTPPDPAGADKSTAGTATAAVAARLGIDHDRASQIVAEVERQRAPVRNLKALLRSIPDDDLRAFLSASSASPTAASTLPPECGQCEARPGDLPSARMVEDDAGRPRPCPRCHPKAVTHAS